MSGYRGDAPRHEVLTDVKRVVHRLLCWMLVLAIAGLPALVAAAGLEDGHAGHALHGAQSKGGDEPADHAAHDHGHSHEHHAHHDHGGHAGAPHGDDPAHETPDSSHSGDPLGHADCVDAACLASCSACGHCQGMPSISGMHLPASAAQVVNLYTFQSGPPAAALYRPPILS